jgi:hypothetical protein
MTELKRTKRTTKTGVRKSKAKKRSDKSFSKKAKSRYTVSRTERLSGAVRPSGKSLTDSDSVFTIADGETSFMLWSVTQHELSRLSVTTGFGRSASDVLINGFQDVFQLSSSEAESVLHRRIVFWSDLQIEAGKSFVGPKSTRLRNCFPYPVSEHILDSIFSGSSGVDYSNAHVFNMRLDSQKCDVVYDRVFRYKGPGVQELKRFWHHIRQEISYDDFRVGGGDIVSDGWSRRKVGLGGILYVIDMVRPMGSSCSGTFSSTVYWKE